MKMTLSKLSNTDTSLSGIMCKKEKESDMGNFYVAHAPKTFKVRKSTGETLKNKLAEIFKYMICKNSPLHKY
jgi:hypothetical protein